MPKVSGRGKVVKHRKKKLPGGGRLHCEVYQKPGPRGGKTVCYKEK